jgi:hypothetical protein
VKLSLNILTPEWPKASESKTTKSNIHINDFKKKVDKLELSKIALRLNEKLMYNISKAHLFNIA